MKLKKCFFKIASVLLPKHIKDRLHQQLRDHYGVPSHVWSLTQMKRLGFNPSTIVDIGAYKGEWTVESLDLFPDANFLMLEAQTEMIPELERVKKANGGRVDYRIALLGADHREEVSFHRSPNAPTGSSVLTTWDEGNTTSDVRSMHKLDDVLDEAGVIKIDLLKMDVQGFELQVLSGALRHLGETRAILLEISLIEFLRDIPLLHDVTAFLWQQGFVAYDICSLMRRPLDGALGQIDVIFVSKDSPLRKDKNWDPPVHL